MAITLDSSSKSGTNWQASPVSSLTWAHTCSGTERVLVVSFFVSNAADTLTGITYAGVSMTRIAMRANGSDRSYLYYLINPSTGTNNIVASFSPNSQYVWGAAESLNGASQTAQPDSYSSNAASGVTTITYTTSVVVDGSWLVLMSRSPSNQTAGAGAYIRQNGTTNTDCCLVDSNATVLSGSRSMTMNGSSSSPVGVIASFAPSGGAAPTFVPRVSFIM